MRKLPFGVDQKAGSSPQATLAEEKATDLALTELAESTINLEAV